MARMRWFRMVKCWETNVAHWLPRPQKGPSQSIWSCSKGNLVITWYPGHAYTLFLSFFVRLFVCLFVSFFLSFFLSFFHPFFLRFHILLYAIVSVHITKATNNTCPFFRFPRNVKNTSYLSPTPSHPTTSGRRRLPTTLAADPDYINVEGESSIAGPGAGRSTTSEEQCALYGPYEMIQDGQVLGSSCPRADGTREVSQPEYLALLEE